MCACVCGERVARKFENSNFRGWTCASVRLNFGIRRARGGCCGTAAMTGVSERGVSAFCGGRVYVCMCVCVLV